MKERIRGLTGQCEGVDILTVVCAGHVLLAQADGVLSGGDAIELFELCLVDALIPSCWLKTPDWWMLQ